MEQQLHVALPKLYGAPAYARPPRQAEDAARPFDPDDLPIAAEMTEEERALLASDGSLGSSVAVAEPEAMHPRPFSLRSFADRLRRPR
jgi:hypothetical protein